MESEQVPVNALFWPVPKKRPMFERAFFDVVRIVKSATKVNGAPWTQLFPVPPLMIVVPVTAATLTSLAVQLRVTPGVLLNASYASWIQRLFWPNAGAAVMATASSATENRTNHFEVIHPVNQPARQPQSRGDPTVRLQIVVFCIAFPPFLPQGISNLPWALLFSIPWPV
jgi:hypothetical protein